MLLDEGKRREDSRYLLRLAQSVQSIFDEEQWAKIQQKLIDES